MLIDMNVGGTEKALLNMISELPRDQFDITILLLQKKGDFLHNIPKDVEIICFEGFKDMKAKLNYAPKKVILELYRNKNYLKAFNLLFLHTILKITKDRRIFFKKLLKNYPKLIQEYDIAVAYAGPMDFISYFVVNKVNAKKKIQWIHFDVTKIGFDKRFVRRVYKKFDQIFVVSHEGRTKLQEVLPTLSEKIKVCPNSIPSKQIREQVEKGIGFNDNFEGLKILTVGRLATEKGQDIGIKVLARLIEEGYNIKWYCIGEGKARKYYEKLIEEYNLQDKFILLGANPNPYPFISECDIYVQLSRHEGYCITLAEARILNKPIVTTDFTGAKEQIIDGKTGLIVGIDESEIFNGIMKLIGNDKLCKVFAENLEKENINISVKDDIFTTAFREEKKFYLL